METLLGREGAFVDRIYFCPHHPDSGFAGERIELKILCECRKPNPGMLERGIREFHGARDRSWLIGDSSVDIEAARRADVKSVLVETGYAGMDYRAWATPHATAPDLESAVSFILDDYPRLISYCRTLSADISPGNIVLIGGPSRSGKSTFTAVFRDALLARGQGAVVLSVDRWLKDEAERQPGVLGRYDMAALQSLVTGIADCERRPGALTLPGYDKKARRSVPGVTHLPISASDVILIEGTVALAIEVTETAVAGRYHVDIDENLRRQRVLHEYRLRGYTEQQAGEVYSARQADEIPVIERLSRGAKRISLADVLA
jgi:uridine kinase